jgi:hypothetical protein
MITPDDIIVEARASLIAHESIRVDLDTPNSKTSWQLILKDKIWDLGEWELIRDAKRMAALLILGWNYDQAHIIVRDHIDISLY